MPKNSIRGFSVIQRGKKRGVNRAEESYAYRDGDIFSKLYCTVIYQTFLLIFLITFTMSFRKTNIIAAKKIN